MPGRRIVATVLLVLLVGCSAPTVQRPRIVSPAPAPAVSPFASAVPSPAPSPSATASWPPCLASAAVPAVPAGVRSVSPVWVLAGALEGPDDILFKDGLLYVGELTSGHIAVLTAGRPLTRLPVVIPRVEGIQVLHGLLYAADQLNNRIDVIDGTSVTTFLQLSLPPGQEGVDGIGLAGDLLLIPDSANHALLWVDTSGRIVRREAGFVRPTGAWALADGSVLVADEYGNAAYRVAPDGTRTALITGLPIVDDVAADREGHTFAITPVTSGGRLTELVGGQARDLASNLLEPQGLDFDGAGNVIVTEFAAGTVDLVIRSYKLVPAGASRPPAGTPLCIDLVRAPGFSDPVQLGGGPGVTVTAQPGAASRGGVLLGDCGQRYCRVTAASGTRTDELWIDSAPGS